MYIYTYYCIFIHKGIKGAIRHGTRAGAPFARLFANAFIYALVSLYLYIIILFFYLKNSYMHSLILFYCYYIISCLSYAKSKLYILYLSHTRAGVRAVGAFWAVVSANRSFCGRSAGIWAACGRVRACFSVRAGAGRTPTIFCARPIPAGLPSHSVRRICGGISSGVVSECD